MPFYQSDRKVIIVVRIEKKFYPLLKSTDNDQQARRLSE